MIINSYESYQSLLERMNREPFVVSPIFRDVYYHVVENALLCVGITFENRDTFIVSVSHDDAMMFPINNERSVFTRGFSPDDVKALAYINGKQLPTIQEFLSPYIQETQAQFGGKIDSNRIVPITVWANVLILWNKLLWNVLDQYKTSIGIPAYTFTKSLIHTLKEIESAGLEVAPDMLVEKFGDKVRRYFKSNRVYSEYNPFTITGRPSNRYATINFAALNKTDGSRDAFISRYPAGKLVQFDFEAYHLRLIADDLGIQLPKWESIHTELAKIYFGMPQISDEMYAASKAKTFEVIYGMTDETFGIELFEKIHLLRKQYQNQTSITLPSGITVEVDTPNASKLFNYYVQSLEVVKTLPKLTEILERIRNTTTQLILYTYDSVLLDTESIDAALLDDITSILEENGKFPVRTYSGTTYGNIKQVS